MAVHTIYSFYAELDDYKPKIWRRFEVNGNKTMAELGYILMTLFEMQASHLFCLTYDFGSSFIKDLRNDYADKDVEKVLGKKFYADLMKLWRYELPFDDIYPNDREKLLDASKHRLKDVTDKPQSKLVFRYDYGDGWQVNLKIESCEKVEISASELPRVLDGNGFGIIEDCGGTGGLEQLAKAFKVKNGRQYDEYREWLGTDDLDLAAFDIDDMNFRLRKLPRIFKDIYEKCNEPTQRSIGLIERRYKNNESNV
ncbi:MAG: plasmid pRiA4b ORF-3 family protein [Clostridia bacterium]|nr:plasmid pRiA4b ORF-3 family protein [Clostridia bacterium]